MIVCLLGIIAIGLLVWLHIAAERAEVRENEAFAQEIAHLPVDMQVQLWAAKFRYDAERDLGRPLP
jgi:hypothetical protein